MFGYRNSVVSTFALALTTAALSAGSAYAKPLDDMISPVTHPVIFEDPRHSTELRPLFVYHELSDDLVTSGGDAQVYALQARFKLTDDFSLIAVKDGLVRLNPDAVVKKDTGLANIALGGKYSFIQTDDAIGTLGMTYEIPWGKKGVLQGQGNGLVNPFISAGYTVGNINLLGEANYRVRLTNKDSSIFDLNAHASYKIDNFYPLVEFGLNHVTNAGSRLPIPDEGEDFFNLGSSTSAGENVVTMGVGARYRIVDNIDIGAAYQFPLEHGPGSKIIDWRITADLIYRFSI